MVGTREGLDAARGAGKRLGRPLAMTPEQISHARDLLSRPNNSVASIARLLGVSRSTLYKHVPKLSGGRTALAPQEMPSAPGRQVGAVHYVHPAQVFEGHVLDVAAQARQLALPIGWSADQVHDDGVGRGGKGSGVRHGANPH